MADLAAVAAAEILVALVVSATDIGKAEHDTLLHLLVLLLMMALKMWEGAVGLNIERLEYGSKGGAEGAEGAGYEEE